MIPRFDLNRNHPAGSGWENTNDLGRISLYLGGKIQFVINLLLFDCGVTNRTTTRLVFRSCSSFHLFGVIATGKHRQGDAY